MKINEKVDWLRDIELRYQNKSPLNESLSHKADRILDDNGSTAKLKKNSI
jgi:hypothetical protein